MSEKQKQEPSRLTGTQIAQLVFGIIIFGFLMGIRGEFASVWIRMIVAGCAGAVLSISVLRFRKSKH
jgi:hypothetical protein